jgi:hypothetical protein
MINGSVIANPGGALPFTVIVRSQRAVIRQEPANTVAEAGHLLERLIGDAEADFPMGLDCRQA